MSSQNQSHPPPQSPPDGLSRQPSASLTEVDRQQASAWNLILTLPDGAAVHAAQKLEAEARKKVAALHPELATDAEMRCALSEWRHARDLWGAMKSFVEGVSRRLEAEAAQKDLDKPKSSVTMAGD